MHLRIPILIAVVGLILAGALAWRAGGGAPIRGTVETSAHPATPESRAAESPEANPAFPQEKADPFPHLLQGDRQHLARESLLPLFRRARGDSLSLPIGTGLAGTVTLVHRHPSGDLAVGLSLAHFKDAEAFFSLAPDGRIEGHLLSKDSATAYRLEITDRPEDYLLKKIRVDELLCGRYEKGRLLPGMPPEPEASAAMPGETGNGAASSVALLESFPGCSRVIYLNFEGDTITGTPWNSSFNGGAPIVAQPFPNPALIPAIWESIAEDYAVFDVNVTTDRAAFESAAPELRVMVIFTPSKAWYGSAGGVAYLESFGSRVNPYCWVFNITVSGAAESGSHEVGHTVGLRHDGTATRDYYSGHTHPSGVSWAPLMGTGYNRQIVQFSRGEYANANRKEDDFELASRYLPFRPDDHGDTPTTASPVAPDGSIAEEGIIGSETDEDWFRVESGTAGPLSVTATPHPRFRNLDVGLELLNEDLEVVIASAPEGPFEASLDLPSLPAGVHYLRVSGTGLGNPTNGYGRYGSVGTYNLNGTYTAAPPPEIPTGLNATNGVSTAGVSLAWTPVSGADGYRLYRGLSPDDAEATLLTSTTSSTHLDESAVAGTIYHYFVTAMRLSRESLRSAGASGWRQFLAPASPGTVALSDDSPHSIRVSWAAADHAQSYRIWRHSSNHYGGAVEIGSTSSLAWHDLSTAPGVPYFYFVEGVNPAGVSAPTGSAMAGVKILMPPGTPTGLTASDGSSALLTLITWEAVDDAIGYRVYRHTIESVTGATEIAQLPPTTLYEDSTSQPDVIYWYFVKAIRAEGDSLPSNLEAGSRQSAAPAVPIDLTATQGSHASGVQISWGAVPDATTYFVYRGTDSRVESAELLGETSSAEWIDEGVEPGRTYRYFVRAGNATGNSAFTGAAPGFGPQRDLLDDIFEENDDLSLATPLTLREIAAIAVEGDPDWYKVTLDPGDTRLDLIVPFETRAGSIRLSLHSAAGVRLASSSAAAGARVLSHTGGAGPTYFILVERETGTAVPYQLTWRSLAPGESGLEPDATIGLTYPPVLGDGLRNANGAGQTLFLRLRAGQTRRVYVTLTSRSAVPGTFLFSGKSSRRPFRLDCERLVGSQWQRVRTPAWRKGVESPLNPLADTSFRLTVRRETGDAKGRSRMSRLFTAKPALGSGPVDVVGIRLSTRGKKGR